jgi:ATP-dependent Lhr-like helicase
VLSVLAATGGLGADELYGRLVGDGAFDGIEPGEFADLLRRLGEEGLVGQVPGSGELILETGGERIVGHYQFYAAFRTPDRFDVRHGGERIGEMDAKGLEPEDHLLLAGRRWEVERVDRERSEILVSPASGKKEPMFRSRGVRDVHRRVRREMRRVLTSEGEPVFVDETAAELLAYARRAAREAGLSERALVSRGGDTLLFPWAGDRTMKTLVAMAASKGIEVETDQFQLTVRFVETGADEVRAFLGEVADGGYSGLELAERMERRDKIVEKYDRYLTETLVDRGYAHNYLDVERARQVASEVTRGGAVQ